VWLQNKNLRLVGTTVHARPTSRRNPSHFRASLPKPGILGFQAHFGHHQIAGVLTGKTGAQRELFKITLNCLNVLASCRRDSGIRGYSMSELFRHSLNFTPTAWFRNPSRICGGGDPATFGKKSECPSLGGYFKMLREIVHLMGKSKNPVQLSGFISANSTVLFSRVPLNNQSTHSQPKFLVAGSIHGHRKATDPVWERPRLVKCPLS